MSAMSILPLRPGGWTVDDLDLLPDDGLRYELVDGALLVTPPPVVRHEVVVMRLALVLGPVLPAGTILLAGGGIRFSGGDYRVPDLQVARAEAVDQRMLDPTQVLLAVEVMSPGGVSTDRLAKPALYAAGGVPHFWRLELEPGVLITYRLDGGVYRETGRFDDEVVVDEPVELRFRLADLLA